MHSGGLWGTGTWWGPGKYLLPFRGCTGPCPSQQLLSLNVTNGGNPEELTSLWKTPLLFISVLSSMQKPLFFFFFKRGRGEEGQRMRARERKILQTPC